MTFKINQVCFDSENKEFVKITNGIMPHGDFIPTEAIAIRIVSLDNTKPVIGFTYRKVDHEKLSEGKDGGFFASILDTEKPVGYKFIGRI